MAFFVYIQILVGIDADDKCLQFTNIKKLSQTLRSFNLQKSSSKEVGIFGLIFRTCHVCGFPHKLDQTGL